MRPRQGWILRHSIDVYPVLVTLAAAALHVALFLCVERPLALVAGTVLLLPLRSLSVTIGHNHHHNRTFRSPALNLPYEALIFFQNGMSSYGWALNHNIGHHQKYKNQIHGSEGQDPYGWLTPDGRILGRFAYAWKTMRRSYGDIWREGRAHPGLRRRWLLATAVYLSLLVAMLIARPAATLIVVVAPIPLLMFALSWVSWAHHVGLDAADDYAASYTYEGRLANLLSFNHGYHLAHHVKPGLHWSLLPAFHASIRHRVPAHCIAGGGVPAVVREAIAAGTHIRDLRFSEGERA